MNGKVVRLCSLDSIPIPEEMLRVSLDAQQVEQELRNLSMRYAAQKSVETAEQGDIVFCTSAPEDYPDGREIILYTALNVPGAEEAVRAALGKRVGDSFSVSLCDRTVRLTVARVIRLLPVEVNDSLIASMGIEGVTTVAAYRTYITEKKTAELQMENSKMAVGYVMEQLLENSTFSYDEAAFEQYLADEMDSFLHDYQDAGMEQPTEEEVRTGVLYQMKQGWLAEEFCRQNHIQIDRAAVEAEAEQMLEMMALMGERVPEREQMLEESVRNAYVMELFGKIGDMVAEKMGGEPHGND